MNSKLKNNDGISILLSLLLFLVVSMVSVTIIASSYSAVKRTHSIKKSTQANITLDSAALLLKNNIISSKYTYKVVGTGINVNLTHSTGNSYFDSYIKDISNDCVTSYLNGSNSTSKCDNTKFTIFSDNENIEVVSVSSACIFGESNDQVIFTLTTKDSNNKLYVKFLLSHSMEGTNTHIVEWTNFEASGKS